MSKCLKCNKTIPELKVRYYNQRYCNRSCSKFAQEPPKTAFKKGQTPWNKGNHEHGNKNLGQWAREHASEASPHWKGNKVTYRALHNWIVNHLGQPDACEFCLESGLKGHDIHWANKSGEYKEISKIG